MSDEQQNDIEAPQTAVVEPPAPLIQEVAPQVPRLVKTPKRGPRGGLTDAERQARRRQKKKLEEAKRKEEEAAKIRTAAKRHVEYEQQKFVKATNLKYEDWDFNHALDTESGRDLLIVGGIRDKNCLDQICRELPETCQELGVIPNSFVWRHSISAYFKSKWAGQNILPDEIPETEWGGRSEAHTRRELFRLYDALIGGGGVNGRKIFDKSVSFDDYLALRDRCRKDLWFLSVDGLKVPLEECVHRVLTEDFYPKLNFDGVYHDDYSLSEVHTAIRKQDASRSWLQLDPRTYMKSALFSVFALQFALNVPDCRIFVLSGTDPLAEQFLRIVKSYIARTEGEPTLINLLFPEYSLTGVDATSEAPVLLPCRKHAQRNLSIWTAGVTSAASGAHADLFGQDDPVQEEGTEVTRFKLKNKIDNLQNIPDAHALKITLGTRYHEFDYYQGLIDLWEADSTTLHYVCRAIWEPKEGFSHIPLENQILEQVNLLWPTRAGSPEETFKAIHNAILRNKTDTRHQLFNDPVSSDGSETVQFTQQLLESSIRQISSFPTQGDKYVFLDVAFSESKRADYSCLASLQIAPNEAKRSAIWVHDVYAARIATAELAYKVAETNWRFKPVAVMIESFVVYDLFVEKVYWECDRRGWPRPNLVKMPIDRTPNAKFKRIKPLQILLADKRLIFANGEFVNLVFDHFLRYDGTRSNGGRKKDDTCDVIGMAAQRVLPLEYATPEDTDQRQREIDEIENKKVMEEQHAMIFDGVSKYKNYVASDFLNPATSQAAESESNRGMWGIPGLRPGAFGPPGNKQIGFGSTVRKSR